MSLKPLSALWDAQSAPPPQITRELAAGGVRLFGGARTSGATPRAAPGLGLPASPALQAWAPRLKWQVASTWGKLGHST